MEVEVLGHLVLDPDGNEMELYVDVPGVDWANDPSSS
jgi:catechol-2,3-dioxygenase